MTPDAAELHRRARKLLPRNVYDYYAGGSGREQTLRASEKAWRQVWLAPRVLREVSSVDTGTRLLGAPALPEVAAALRDSRAADGCEVYADGGICWPRA